MIFTICKPQKTYGHCMQAFFLLQILLWANEFFLGNNCMPELIANFVFFRDTQATIVNPSLNGWTLDHAATYMRESLVTSFRQCYCSVRTCFCLCVCVYVSQLSLSVRFVNQETCFARFPDFSPTTILTSVLQGLP